MIWGDKHPHSNVKKRQIAPCFYGGLTTATFEGNSVV